MTAHPGYRELPVPGALRELVECVWLAELPSSAPAHRQRVVPDGCTDLLLLSGVPLLAGPDRSGFETIQASGTVISGLRLRPGACPALLGVPALEIRDRRTPLAQVHPMLAARVSAALEQGRLGHLALLRAVAEQTALTDPPDPAVRRVHELARRGVGAEEIADSLGWTGRHLHRRTQAAFGYGPATLRRVLRFRRAMRLAWSGVPAAEVAARAGYADQAHLSREVRALAGAPLRQLVPRLGTARRPAPTESYLRQGGFTAVER